MSVLFGKLDNVPDLAGLGWLWCALMSAAVLSFVVFTAVVLLVFKRYQRPQD